VIYLLPASADVFTWMAIVLVPIGCAIALGWAMRGARPWLALLSIPLLVLAWSFQSAPMGELAGTLLIAGSAVALGRLLAGAAAPSLLKIAVIAMAAVDSYLVFSNKLQAPNAVLVAAKPAAGVPSLQSAGFGPASLGYGDYFAAALVGGILAVERGNQVRAAAAVFIAALAWDQLFAFYAVLPATVPPAVVLVGYELQRRVRRLNSVPPRSRGGDSAPDAAPLLPER
jgi:hypothetical protein